MFEELVGTEVCGCTVLEILPSEGKGAMALVDTHCPKCGVHKVRVRNLLGKQKNACPHAAYESRNQDKMRATYEKRMREHAEACIGKDIGTFHVHEIVENTPFKKRALRTYVRVACIVCGRETILDAQHIEKAKCTGCSQQHSHGGVTAKYPRLYASLKRHWQKCYDPSCDGYYMCGGKGWHFDERWIRIVNGKQMLNTQVAIEDCVGMGWDESNKRMILEKDKLAKEFGERVIGRQTVRCVDRSENYTYRFDD